MKTSALWLIAVTSYATIANLILVVPSAGFEPARLSFLAKYLIPIGLRGQNLLLFLLLEQHPELSSGALTWTAKASLLRNTAFIYGALCRNRTGESYLEGKHFTIKLTRHINEGEQK